MLHTIFTVLALPFRLALWAYGMTQFARSKRWESD